MTKIEEIIGLIQSDKQAPVDNHLEPIMERARTFQARYRLSTAFEFSGAAEDARGWTVSCKAQIRAATTTRAMAFTAYGQGKNLPTAQSNARKNVTRAAFNIPVHYEDDAADIEPHGEPVQPGKGWFETLVATLKGLPEGLRMPYAVTNRQSLVGLSEQDHRFILEETGLDSTSIPTMFVTKAEVPA